MLVMWYTVTSKETSDGAQLWASELLKIMPVIFNKVSTGELPKVILFRSISDAIPEGNCMVIFTSRDFYSSFVSASAYAEALRSASSKLKIVVRSRALEPDAFYASALRDIK
ncbi:MAG TPA: hypothetical protein VK658_13965 [Chryseolinea sp.]|nr:hypothetical protein [Chryseolinea sp.]